MAAFPVEPPHTDTSQRAPRTALFGPSARYVMNTGPVDEPLHVNDANTLTRLAAIESHIHHIETRLGLINEFNSRLDEIHDTLDTVIGFVTPDRTNESLVSPSTHIDRPIADAEFRIVAHVSRDGHGAQLTSDMSWPDTWSVRMFVTALLRNLSRHDRQQCRRYWCDIWTPDESGERVDSAILNPDTRVIEWASDITKQ
jgi:hypothetical protein